MYGQSGLSILTLVYSELIMCTTAAMMFMMSTQMMAQRSATRQATNRATEARNAAEMRAASGLEGDTGPTVASPAARPKGIRTLQVGGSSGGGTSNLSSAGTSGGTRKKVPANRFKVRAGSSGGYA